MIRMVVGAAAASERPYVIRPEQTGQTELTMRNTLEKSFETRAVTDESGRLRRPIAVAIVGCFLAFAVGVLTLARSGGGGATPVGLIATFAIGSVLSIAYAIIGAKVSKDAANRFIGIAGGLVALAGVAYVIYLVKSAPF